MSNPKGIDQTNRRTWDKETFSKKAVDRALREDDPLGKKKSEPTKSMKDMKPAQARADPINLEFGLGRTYQITETTPESQMGGFFCDVCDCVIKDSQNYLDHINGKKHQRALGTSLTPERATLNQVRARFKFVKTKKKQETVQVDFEEKMARLRALEEQRKKEQKDRKKEEKEKKKQEKKKEEEENSNPELESLGLPVGFGTSKK